MAKVSSLRKPSLTREAVLDFAEGAQRGATVAAPARGKARSELAPKGQKSGLVPDGDVRLVANVRADIHMKIRMRAVQERTTVGELIEAWVESWK